MKLRFLHMVFALLPYLLISQVSVEEIGEMPPELSENSGLIFYNGKLISHNDSGNTPELYEIDTVSMQVNRIVTISNAVNIDWEDITQDENYIYIADIGNYFGTREDLSIYKISKQDFDSSGNVAAEKINFAYEDQSSFEDNGKSNWDAEALFVLNDQLVILTKQWLGSGTVAYSVTKEPGNHTAKRLDTYQVDGLVTGASFNPLSNELLILGHSSILVPFVNRVNGVTTSTIFGGNVENLPFDIGFAQTEGIAYISQNRFFISSEHFQRSIPAINLNPLLYSLQMENEVNSNEEMEPNPEIIEDSLLLYKKYGSNILEYELSTKKRVLAQAVFDTSGKMVHFKQGSEIEHTALDLISLKSGVYYLTFYLGDKIISKPFVSN
ncbi:MAG: T9SS type A sorting domain-containing protein [Maribacter sp.]|nr:T9SS type A sorting domain-containing protein [Maribacter sp.]